MTRAIRAGETCTGPDPQPALLNQVQAAWKTGDLDSILSLSQSMTNADAKAAAATYVSNVNAYKGYMSQAQSQAQSNPQKRSGS